MARRTGTGFVQAASAYIGTPYVWGGASPAGFDCSGLVEYVLTAKLGLTGVPRTSEEQWKWVAPVTWRNVQAGDLVFMNFPGEVSPGHVSIYAGRGKVVVAPTTGQLVQLSAFTPAPAGSQVWGSGVVVGYGRVPGLAYSRAGQGGRRRALPPRPAAGDTGGSSASSGGGDSAAAAWAGYDAELAAGAGAGGGDNSRFAGLNFFGWQVPGTGWIPFNIDPLSPIPGVPGLDSFNPLHWFEEAGNAVNDIGTFFHWIAWIFSPRNILRVVEFLAGAGLILVGLRFAMESYRAGHSGGDESKPKRAGSLARNAFAATPVGREVAAARAATGGRQAARQARRKAAATSRAKQAKRARTRAQAAARQPSETRAGHKARRAKERKDSEVPF